ncbi:hypothetical protein J4G37_43870, partial [Microvirga sp. 3-52]|nr:hypothetical protein [Microvirga sp. 3-52]
MRIKLLYIPIMVLLVLVGCSKDGEPTVKDEPTAENIETDKSTDETLDEETAIDDDDDSEKVVVEDVITGASLPTSLTELEGLLPGETNYLSTLETEGDLPKIDELTARLPNIKENPTNEELDKYYEAL